MVGSGNVVALRRKRDLMEMSGQPHAPAALPSFCYLLNRRLTRLENEYEGFGENRVWNQTTGRLASISVCLPTKLLQLHRSISIVAV
jgi:hypothetical protein